MNCPYCGGTMIKGLFCDRGDSYFLPEGETPPQLWTKGILKKNGLFYCRRKVLALYGRSGLRHFGADSAES